ncbi:large ribosomal subunit protein bL28 [Streptomyces sp. BI20]|uniref:large ribosomal subunit protein bL28 n=1 Tax=Streptomyces sp. BI20 TaxID=3403460 RepID=UPI003C79276E
MSSKCDVCEKVPSFGRVVSRLGKGAQVRRVKGRSPRMFRPNVQVIHTSVNGTPKRVNACTSCIKGGKVERRVKG